MICVNDFCEEQATHKAYGEFYCFECIHEHIYDDFQPDVQAFTWPPNLDDYKI